MTRSLAANNATLFSLFYRKGKCYYIIFPVKIGEVR